MLGGEGPAVHVPAYTSWWLSTHPILNGQRPDRLRRHGSTELSGLYDEAPPWAPGFLLCPSTLADLLADVDSAVELLYRLGEPARTVPAWWLTGCYAWVAAALDGVEVPAPSRVRTVTGRVVDAAEAMLLDVPYALPLLDRAVVPAGAPFIGRTEGNPVGPGSIADLLGVPLASELVTGRIETEPVRRLAWQEVPGAPTAARRLGLPHLPGRVAVHADLTVDGRSVGWWPDGDTDHIRDGDDGPALGRALAWRHGQWLLRAALAEALGDADRSAGLAAEDAAAGS